MVFKKLFKFFKKTFRFKRGGRRNKKHARAKNRKPSIRIKQKKQKSKKRVIKKKKIAAIKPKPQHSKTVELGAITHYFPQVKAAVLKLKSGIAIGDPILIRGKTYEFRQTVGSLQIDRKPIEKAKKGQEIGLEVLKDVHVGDEVYKCIK